MLMTDVRRAFDAVPTRGHVIKIDRRDHELHKGGHFQGIQLLQGSTDRVVLSSSSSSVAYLVTATLNSAGTAGRVENVRPIANSPLAHCGGIQLFGRILAAGVEDDNSRDRSQAQFWRMREPRPPQLIRSVRRIGRTAGAAGIATAAGRTYVAVGGWNSASIDFYRANGDPFTNPKIALPRWRTWNIDQADKTGWVDTNFGSYQALNLIGQRDGQLFMLGFNRNSGGDDWMDLYSIDLRSNVRTSRMLRKIGKRRMTCKDGASFRAAAGLHIRSAARFDVWAAKGTSGNWRTGTTIVLNRFAD